MLRRPQRSKRTDTLFPYTTLFRSIVEQRRGGKPREAARVGQYRQRPPRAAPGDERFCAVAHDERVVQFHRRIGIERLRSEEHTSELQSLMRISYAVFCLKKKKQ